MTIVVGYIPSPQPQLRAMGARPSLGSQGARRQSAHRRQRLAHPLRSTVLPRRGADLLRRDVDRPRPPAQAPPGLRRAEEAPHPPNTNDHDRPVRADDLAAGDCSMSPARTIERATPTGHTYRPSAPPLPRHDTTPRRAAAELQDPRGQRIPVLGTREQPRPTQTRMSTRTSGPSRPASPHSSQAEQRIQRGPAAYGRR